MCRARLVWTTVAVSLLVWENGRVCSGDTQWFVTHGQTLYSAGYYCLQYKQLHCTTHLCFVSLWQIAEIIVYVCCEVCYIIILIHLLLIAWNYSSGRKLHVMLPIICTCIRLSVVSCACLQQKQAGGSWLLIVMPICQGMVLYKAN